MPELRNNHVTVLLRDDFVNKVFRHCKVLCLKFLDRITLYKKNLSVEEDEKENHKMHILVSSDMYW